MARGNRKWTDDWAKTKPEERKRSEPAEPPRTPEPPRERILDGVFDHAEGCRGADYGECTCGVSGSSTLEPTDPRYLGRR